MNQSRQDFTRSSALIRKIRAIRVMPWQFRILPSHAIATTRIDHGLRASKPRHSFLSECHDRILHIPGLKTRLDMHDFISQLRIQRRF